MYFGVFLNRFFADFSVIQLSALDIDNNKNN